MSAAHPAIEGLELLQPKVFEDDRGHFLERWNHRRFNDVVGYEVRFVQDNQSRSLRGVLRGLHYQVSPSPQGKLVSCISGAVFDVAVDIRRSSPTFGAWFGIELTAENHRQLWIPEGFAHGFLALSDGAELLYKTTDYYDPAAERSILWDDPEIGIEWPVGGEPPLVSPKDALAQPLADAEVFA